MFLPASLSRLESSSTGQNEPPRDKYHGAVRKWPAARAVDASVWRLVGSYLFTLA
jgi:hypothetical protein